MSIRDTFAQPRSAATALRGLAEGAWEYRAIPAGAPIPAGWVVVGAGVYGVLIKYVHQERVF